MPNGSEGNQYTPPPYLFFMIGPLKIDTFYVSVLTKYQQIYVLYICLPNIVFVLWKESIQELRRAMLTIRRKLGGLKAVPSNNEQLWAECNGAWHGPKNLPKYIH